MKTEKFDLEDRMTAYHEAGHAVMSYLCKNSVNYVWAKPGTYQSFEFGGLTISSKPRTLSDIVSDPEQRARICCASRITEQMFFPNDWKEKKWHSSTDWENLKESLGTMGYGPEQIQNVVISTKKILSKKETRKLIRKFAWVLLHHNKHLDYIEIGIIFGYIKRKWRIKRKLTQTIYKIKRWLKSHE